MRVLITGSRAPVALDLSRRFRRAGHTVIQADSLKYGIGMWSNSATKSLRVPRPVDCPRGYVESLAAIVDEERVDWMIPTCEEVFFIAAHRGLLNCDVLIDDLEKLAGIHNKWTFSQSSGNDYAQPPETLLIDGRDGGAQLVDDSLPAFESPADWVFKPVYSRFASRTLVGPTVTQLRKLAENLDEPWIVQRRIRGTEYSTYSVAHDGRLLAHATYQSLYHAGRGAGIFFEPVRHQPIEDYVAQFVESRGYTGQIGFDFIRDAGSRFWVLEANPRATSGVHLFADTDPLIDALTRDRGTLIRPSTTRPVMVEFAMPFWGLWDAIRRGRWKQVLPDIARSRTATLSLRDPWPTVGLLPALAEIAIIAIKEGRTLQQAATFDIEWNGGPM